MDCEEIRTMLAGYADGELTLLEARTVEKHVETCGRCRQTLHDQQRVQHVLRSLVPPPVEDDRWNAVGKALRAELEGKGEPVVLRTRPHVEALDPTPLEQPVQRPAEAPPLVAILEPLEAPAEPPPEAAAPAEARRPEPPPVPRTAQPRPPSITVLRVRPRKRRRPYAWVAHAFGALAAAAIVVLALTSVLMPTPRPLVAASALARQEDVQIHGIYTEDPDYVPVYFAGAADDVAAVWVVPVEGRS